MLTDTVDVHVVRVFCNGETKLRFKAKTLPTLYDFQKKECFQF